jgi:hypothetical protein
MKITRNKILSFFAWGFGLMIVLFLVVTLLLSLFADKLVLRVVDQLKQNITSDISIEKIDASILPYFPSTAIRMQGVIIHDTQDSILLDAKELSFKISLWKLLFSDINLQAIKIKNASIHLVKFKNGKWNYEVFKEIEEESSEDKAYSINIREASFENVDFIYSDLLLKNEYSFYIINSKLNLNYNKDQLDIVSSGKTLLDHIILEENTYLSDKTLDYQIDLNIDLTNQIYVFKPSVLDLAKIPVALEGRIEEQETQRLFDLKLTSSNVNPGNLLQLLPEAQAAFYKQIDISGSGNMEMNITGKMTEKQMPDINIHANIQDGEFKNKRFGISLSAFTGSLDWNIKPHISSMKAGFTAINADNSLLAINYEWIDGPRQKVHFSGQGKIPIAFLAAGFGPQLDRAEGHIQMNDIKINGNPKIPEQLSVAGNLTIDNSSLRLSGENISFPSINFDLFKDKIAINSFFIEGLGSDIDAKGQINQYLGILFPKITRKPNYKLELFADNLQVSKIQEFMNKLFPDTIQNETLGLPEFLNWNHGITASIERLYYEKLKFESFQYNAEMVSGALSGMIKANAFEGKLEAKFNLETNNVKKLDIITYLDKVRIEQLFFQFDQFGQETMTDKHISGQLDARISTNIYWNDNWEMDMNKLYTICGLKVSNGQLKEFPILYDFSKFVKIDDLKNVKFTTMQNYLEIKNRTIYLPVMFIQSNAVNLHVFGTHTFDQNVDYSVQVNAGQVMMNKFKKHDPNLSPIPVRHNGLFNLYYSIYGHLDHLQYKSNKSSIKKNLQKSESDKKILEQKLLHLFGPSEVLLQAQMIEIEKEIIESEEEYIEFQ